eukprot:gene33811-43389_t
MLSNGDLIAGVANTGEWSSDLPNAQNRAFVAAFVKEYGHQPSMYAAQAYDAAMLIDSAVKAVGGKVDNREALIAALKAAKFNSLRGSFKFAANHFPIQNQYARVVTKGADGKYVNNMTATVLNSLQFGIMLFLIASGLTLIFGVMNFINLAHGSFFMIGAYLAAWIADASGSFWLGLLGALPLTALLGFLLGWLVLRRLYQKDHMAQVLATFALILICNDAVRMIWGPQPLPLNMPPVFAGPVLLWGLPYSSYRLLVMALGIVVAL